MGIFQGASLTDKCTTEREIIGNNIAIQINLFYYSGSLYCVKGPYTKTTTSISNTGVFVPFSTLQNNLHNSNQVIYNGAYVQPSYHFCFYGLDDLWSSYCGSSTPKPFTLHDCYYPVAVKFYTSSTYSGMIESMLFTDYYSSKPSTSSSSTTASNKLRYWVSEINFTNIGLVSIQSNCSTLRIVDLQTSPVLIDIENYTIPST